VGYTSGADKGLRQRRIGVDDGRMRSGQRAEWVDDVTRLAIRLRNPGTDQVSSRRRDDHSSHIPIEGKWSCQLSTRAEISG
jgi:hypothetical protein